MQTLKQGFLVSIEGIDGAGKSTIARLLFDHYNQKVSTLLTKEPGGTLLGQQIRTILQLCAHQLDNKTEFLLFAADRAEHFKKIIIPAYQEKKMIISDRLHDSSLAYQGYGRTLDLKTITFINQWIMESLQPTLTVYLKVEPHLALERLHKRGTPLSSFDQEKTDFFEKVIEGFETIFAQRTNVITINACLSPLEIINTITPYIETYLHQLYEHTPNSRPLEYLGGK
jgi:dTMP kinase